MRITRRETEVLDYLRKEAKVFRSAAEPEHMSREAKIRYRGMADALDRVAGEILDGEHREYADGKPNATETALGLQGR